MTGIIIPVNDQLWVDLPTNVRYIKHCTQKKIGGGVSCVHNPLIETKTQ